MLLEVDGLSKGWENGIPSFWTSDRNGDLDFEDLPYAIRRLNGAGCSQAAFVDRCRSVDMTRFGSERQQRHSQSSISGAEEDEEQRQTNVAGAEEDEEQRQTNVAAATSFQGCATIYCIGLI